MAMSELDRKAELSRSLADVRSRILDATAKASRTVEELTLVVVTRPIRPAMLRFSTN